MAGEGTAAGQELIVWSPTNDSSHAIGREGLSELAALAAEGGRLIKETATEAGACSIRILALE